MSNPTRSRKSKPSSTNVPLQEKWRINICKRLTTILGDEKLAFTIEDELYREVQKDTSENEKTLFHDAIFKHRYMYRMQTILLNLDTKSYLKNKELLPKVLSGSITPHELVTMPSTQLFPEKWEEIKKKQDAENDFLYKNQRKATSKRIKCFACGGNEVCTTEAQTRSADEPMTTFYECLKCHNKWRS